MTCRRLPRLKEMQYLSIFHTSVVVLELSTYQWFVENFVGKEWDGSLILQETAGKFSSFSVCTLTQFLEVHDFFCGLCTKLIRVWQRSSELHRVKHSWISINWTKQSWSMLIWQVWLLHLPNREVNLCQIPSVVGSSPCRRLLTKPLNMFGLVNLGIIISATSWNKTSGREKRVIIPKSNFLSFDCHLIVIKVFLQKKTFEGFKFPLSGVKPPFGSCSQETQTFRTPEPSNSYLSLTSWGSVPCHRTTIEKEGTTYHCSDSGNCVCVYVTN